MIGLLVVTHGGLAAELVEAARRIVQESAPVQALALDWDHDIAEGCRRIEEALKELDKGEGMIIATDMLGGTPANVAMTFLEPGKVEVVTGVNLPMLIKFSNLRGENDLAEVASLLADKGRSHITVAGEILAGRKEGGP
jgi:PTS system mannose-specific IIA component